jgi:bidirectional [NiFe] hydrogenase diaphorase subunit
MDETSCMVDVARFFMDFCRSESCGKCVPCRVGTTQIHQLLERITSGQGTPADLDRLEELSDLVKNTSLCGLGQTAPNPVMSTLRYFREEYLAHIDDRRCPAGTCRMGGPKEGQ